MGTLRQAQCIAGDWGLGTLRQAQCIAGDWGLGTGVLLVVFLLTTQESGAITIFRLANHGKIPQTNMKVYWTSPDFQASVKLLLKSASEAPRSLTRMIQRNYP
ncbi:MAG: hypothetical protein HEQ35_07155 [Gloeotrichia echinulata IR180]|nr:hypothetical protein [Gloeotrichia echinulata DEX184]